MHATEFLKKTNPADGLPVLALFGSERHLKLEVLRAIPGVLLADDGSEPADDDEVNLTRVNGKDAELRNVLDELQTVSMFGDRRIVLIDEADDFVSDNRAALEKYTASPANASMLILDVTKWMKSTNLYKAFDAVGMNVECSEIKGAALLKWLQETAASVHEKQLARQPAELMVQLAGTSLGMLQQELAKVAALVGDASAITVDDVTQVVGGWRIQTTWDMLDAIRDGNVGAAIENLDKLFLAGESPLKVMGGLIFNFRKYADATEIARTTRDLPGSLKSAGVFPNAVGKAEAYLKRLGFDRASQILQLLVETDANMKGGSRVDPKTQMEALFVKLAG